MADSKKTDSIIQEAYDTLACWLVAVPPTTGTALQYTL